MFNFIRQIGLDALARLRLLGSSTFQADVVAEFWDIATVRDRHNNSSQSRYAVEAWVRRRGAAFPLRFVGFRFADGYSHRPTYIDLTIHGFEVGPVEEYQSFEDSLNLIWSSPLWEGDRKQTMYWAPAEKQPLVPVV